MRWWNPMSWMALVFFLVAELAATVATFEPWEP
jgi:hypothetical protein